MGKSRRSSEENKRINITAVTLLVIIFITWLFLLIFLLFSKVETDKEIKNINENIEMLKLDTNNLNSKKDEINLILSGVENPSVYMDIQKENYKASLSIIEDKIKDFESEEKIAYLTFVVDKEDNLEDVIDIINSNNILATFFTNSKEAADTIYNNGHLIGLYIDDEDKVENVKEEYKDLIDTYNPDLFMLSNSLKEKDITIDSFYKVTENSSAEGKKLLNKEGYTNDIVETTADRDFLIIRINISNSVGVSSIDGIISKLKDKNYIFLPLISNSSLIEK